ncbi:hypothetical protein M3484_14870 [Pseudomonas sp. GX19020]|uniref:hypothetical protein n=1 Tax=Pseudomonadota TaxID=1224 RepID=UPI00089ABE96|nr:MULTISPECIES: hypothetical protein [Pseudomonadota]MCL4067857.1 hypothetical protein [Pseudomonas sp. GX19020]SEC40873.1 hypothetical protein SAMN05519105_2529 [Rhodobacter sp. 24-YEA-8]
MSRILSSAFLVLALGAGAAAADVCNYRLSEMIALRAPKLAAAAADAAVVGRFDPTAPDFLTLVDSSTGFSAVGAVVAGANAAKALGGAEAALGAGSTVLTSSALGVAAGAAALGIVGLEGVCHFKAERLTDYYEVLAVLAAVAETADRDFFQLQLGPARKKGAVVEIWDTGSGVRKQYPVAELYFVNGELKYRRWGFNKSLGMLMQFEGGIPKVEQK